MVLRSNGISAILSFPTLISALIIFSDVYSFIMIVLCFLQLNTNQRNAIIFFFFNATFTSYLNYLFLKYH